MLRYDFKLGQRRVIGSVRLKRSENESVREGIYSHMNVLAYFQTPENPFDHLLDGSIMIEVE